MHASVLVAIAIAFSLTACATPSSSRAETPVSQQPPSQAQCVCDDAFEVPAGRQFINAASSFLTIEELNEAQPDYRLQGYDMTFLRYQGSPSAESTRGHLVSLKPLALLVAGMRVVLNPCRTGNQRSLLPVESVTSWRGHRIDVEVGAARVEFPSSILRLASSPASERAAYHLTLDVGALRYTQAKGIQPRDNRHRRSAEPKSTCAAPMRVQYTGMVITPDGEHEPLRLAIASAKPDVPNTLHLQKAMGLVIAQGRFQYQSTQHGLTKPVAGSISSVVVNGHELVGRFDVDEQADSWTPDALVRALKADGFKVKTIARNELRLWTLMLTFEGRRA